MICNLCSNTDMVQGCDHCDWNDDMCSYCDGTGHVECPQKERDWHK